MGTKRVGLARMQALIENLKRELNMNQSTFTGLDRRVIAVSAAKTLVAGDSGATIVWTHSGTNHDITLPAAKKGLNFRFVIAVGHAAAHDINCAGSDEVYGRVTVMSKTENKTDTQAVAKGAGDTTISLHESTVTLGGDYGDVIELVCAEDGYWLCSALLHLTTGNPSGTAVLN
tara:strand:- start:884 stop:1405 length:522 start_codon:yes stop_codon:yes gene_type:complete